MSARAKLNKVGTAPRRYSGLKFWCPGCNSYHRVPVAGVAPSVWDWNNSLDRPTLRPSILVHKSGNQPRCHSHVEDGRIRYGGDCTHALAGQTVDLPPVDREEREGGHDG